MKTERNFYKSPFPRKKTNDIVFKMSKIINSNNNKISLEIPPSLTKSYMKKNPLYYDLKKFKEKNLQNLDTNKCKKFEKNSNFNYNSDKPPSVKNVICNHIIEKIINYKNDMLDEKPELDGGKEILIGINKSNSHNLYDNSVNYMNSSNIIKKILTNNKTLIKNYKNYGNVPDYLNEFKIRETIEREYERLIKDEKTYPFDTIKLSNIERMNILNKLYSARNDFLTQLGKFPITSNVRSIKIQNKKREVESKLDEVEYTIRIFERSEVFLKN